MPRRPFSRRANGMRATRDDQGVISMKFATLDFAASVAALSAARPFRQRRPAQRRAAAARRRCRRKRRTTACSTCSRTATRRNLKRNPIFAHCSAATCATPTSSATTSPTNIMPARRRRREAELAALHAIDRASLNATDQLAYDVFEYSTKDTLKGYQPRDSRRSPRSARSTISSASTPSIRPSPAARARAPFKTVADYDNNSEAPRRLRRRCSTARSAASARARQRRVRDQDDDPQRHRAARHPAQAEARGFALLRPGQEIPGTISALPTRRG